MRAAAGAGAAARLGLLLSLAALAPHLAAHHFKKKTRPGGGGGGSDGGTLRRTVGVAVGCMPLKSVRRREGLGRWPPFAQVLLAQR